MIEQIWDAILKFTAQFVIPDWGSVIALLPLVMLIVVVLFLGRVVLAYATAGPKRIRPARRKPIPPPGVHLPGPTFAPVLGAIGTFLLLFGLVFGGPSVLVGLTALVLALLYWGREALADFDHVAGEHPEVPVVVHEGPPAGVHMPGPSFRPILVALAIFVLFVGLVFGGWLLGIGVLVTIITLLGWLSDARKEYRHVVAADRTGHIENEPAPGWPKTVLGLMGVLVVVSVVLNLGWFPPKSASGGSGEASPAPSGGKPGELVVVAQNIKFSVTTLNAPAGKPFKITFDNKDAGIPHDIDILDASGAKIFDGKDFNGPKVEVYDVPAIEAATYKFHCSIHPQAMFGELIAGP